MAGLLDSLGALFAGGAGPAHHAIGQPLIQALLAKHGAALPELGKAGANVADIAAGPKVGSDVSSPEAQASNVFDKLPTVDTPGVLGASGDSGIKAALATNAAKPQGFLDRIGSFLHSDEGRAEAMRFAAGAFKGGMAGGLDAATSFADQRHKEASATATEDANRAERGREFDSTDAFRTGQLNLQSEQNQETAAHYRRGDMNDSRRIDADLYKHDTPSGDARTQSQTSILTHLRPSGDAVVNNQERRFEHLTPSGDTSTTQAAETARNTQDNQTAIVTANLGHPTPNDSIHLHYQATPGTLGAQHAAAVAAVRPSQVQPGDANAAVAHITSDAEYEALPSGKKFAGPDGQVRIKP